MHAHWHKIYLQEPFIHGLTSILLEICKNKNLPIIKCEIMEKERVQGSIHQIHTLKKTCSYLQKKSKEISQGVHSINLFGNTVTHKILKNIPNFTKYWKMPSKIVLLKLPLNIPFPIKKTSSFTRYCRYPFLSTHY